MAGAYLDRAVFDPEVLGWHPKCHDQVRAQGGSWRLLAYWSGDPPAHRNCLVVLDVPDPGALTDLVALKVPARDPAELRAKLKATRLDEATRVALASRGFDTTKATAFDMLRELVDEPAR